MTIPYFTPCTMPDGSTRPPIVERIPGLVAGYVQECPCYTRHVVLLADGRARAGIIRLPDDATADLVGMRGVRYLVSHGHPVPQTRGIDLDAYLNLALHVAKDAEEARP